MVMEWLYNGVTGMITTEFWGAGGGLVPLLSVVEWWYCNYYYRVLGVIESIGFKFF